MISEVNFSAFIYRLLHEDISQIIGTNTVSVCLLPEFEQNPVFVCCIKLHDFQITIFGHGHHETLNYMM